MKTNKRRIMSAALVVVMILSVSTFIACGESESEQDIMVNMKITGSDREICDMPLKLTGTPSELTVLAATRKMCVDVQEVEFDYDVQLDAVKRIGADIVEFFINEYPTEEPVTEAVEEATEEGAEEQTTEAAAVVHDFYYDWVCTINGVESTISDTVKEGDSIVWEWKQVQRELDK
ncbi:MAG: hypothetical protein FWD23_02625 [Oscillospiraceae bacterium]|nr:hypothetical protein [Oscillospiraceae bacterium]